MLGGCGRSPAGPPQTDGFTRAPTHGVDTRSRLVSTALGPSPTSQLGVGTGPPAPRPPTNCGLWPAGATAWPVVGTYWPHPADRLVMTVSHTCTPFVRGSNPLPPPLTEWSAGIGTMRRASPHEEDGGEGRPPPASDERDYGGSQSMEGRRSRRRLHLAEVPRKLERQYDTPTAFRCLPCAALSEC